MNTSGRDQKGTELLSKFNTQKFKLQTEMLSSNWYPRFFDYQYLEFRKIGLISEIFHIGIINKERINQRLILAIIHVQSQPIC